MSPSKRLVPDAEDAPQEQVEAPAEQLATEQPSTEQPVTEPVAEQAQPGQSVGDEGVVVAQGLTAMGGMDDIEERLRQREARMKAEAEAKAAAEPITYTVVYGDTLWGLAERFYGEGIQYTRIYEANKELIGPDPNVLYPDWVLTIPRP